MMRGTQIGAFHGLRKYEYWGTHETSRRDR